MLPHPFDASASSDAFVAVTPTAQTLSIGLMGDYLDQGFFFDFVSQETAAVSVGFDLTEGSILRLNFCACIGYGNGKLLDAHGNTILPDVFNAPGGTLLAPGMYEFDLSAQGFSSVSGPYIPGFGTNLQVSMVANFTPVVPEPRGTLMTLSLLAMVAGCASFRLRRIT